MANPTRTVRVTILKRALARATTRGLVFKLGVEAEFYVYRKEPDGYHPLTRQRFLGPCPAYDVYQNMQAMPFLDPMVRHMNSLGWEVYSFDQEGGHGQIELDFAYTDALTTCDRLIFMRFMAKQVASSIGAIASFMPKPFSNDFRSGAHFNMSLASAAHDANIFDRAHSPVGALGERYQIDFPDAAFHFVGGLLAHAPALTAVCCPTFNSYKGLIAQGDMPDMSWAPVLRCYGRNNRSAMIRLPMNRPCVENRSPDISANFYLAAALSVAAGLDGMEHKTDPGAPWNENLYELVEGRPVEGRSHGGTHAGPAATHPDRGAGRLPVRSSGCRGLRHRVPRHLPATENQGVGPGVLSRLPARNVTSRPSMSDSSLPSREIRVCIESSSETPLRPSRKIRRM